MLLLQYYCLHGGSKFYFHILLFTMGYFRNIKYQCKNNIDYKYVINDMA